MELSDFPQPFIAVVLLKIHGADLAVPPDKGPVRGISRFSCIKCPRMHRVSDSAGPVANSVTITPHTVLPSLPSDEVGTPEWVILELNTRPVEHPDLSGRLPLSTLHVSRVARDCPRMTRGHDGSATPFMWGFCIPYSMAVYPGAFWTTRIHPLMMRNFIIQFLGAGLSFHWV
ncbi:MAG: hypothetical protein JW883_12610 [Deltaproteobacteria bacterium]|nr:hypothetical protein [Deltaproteobacteria bacterium]